MSQTQLSNKQQFIRQLLNNLKKRKKKTEIIRSVYPKASLGKRKFLHMKGNIEEGTAKS